jgi:hypothetical protein
MSASSGVAAARRVWRAHASDAAVASDWSCSTRIVRVARETRLGDLREVRQCRCPVQPFVSVGAARLIPNRVQADDLGTRLGGLALRQDVGGGAVGEGGEHEHRRSPSVPGQTVRGRYKQDCCVGRRPARHAEFAFGRSDSRPVDGRPAHERRCAGHVVDILIEVATQRRVERLDRLALGRLGDDVDLAIGQAVKERVAERPTYPRASRRSDSV